MSSADPTFSDLNPLKVLDRKETAAILNCSTKTLDRLRSAGDFPQPVRVSERCIGWKVGTVAAWLKAREGLSEKAAAAA
jgi:predicted DNA-binding transcriptional regulator AlpA